MKRFLFIMALSLSPLHASDSGDSQTLSLAGEWRFHRDEQNVGFMQKWFENPLPKPVDGPATVRLPGSTDEAKAGIPNPKQPSLDGLYRPNIFTGAAWYQREIEIPSGWKNKLIMLTLERVHGVSQVWLNGTRVESAENSQLQDYGPDADSLVSPHRYYIGTCVEPCKMLLTICVDNAPQYSLGTFVSINYEGTQTNWNGIVGKIELRATDPVRIKSIQVHPDVERKMAKVAIRVDNTPGQPIQGEIEISAVARGTSETIPTKTIAFSAEGAEALVKAELPMGDNVRFWDEFSPSLYDLSVTLKTNGKPAFSDERKVTFGMRSLVVRGTQFAMNGRPIYVRGTLECAIFPLTAYPPCDVPAWTRICKIIKSYGLNTLRFHSWTPPEAAFTAADEEGVMIQTEAPQANVAQGKVPERDRFIAEESRRILEAYGNHPSFCFFTFGNEMDGSGEALDKLIEEFKTSDPRHLYSDVSNGFGHDIWTKNRQFTLDAKLRGVGGPGTEREFQSGRDGLPQLSHEIGQWTFLPNFDEMKKYTGVLEAKNFEIVRDQMKEKGLLDLAPQMAEAVGKQAILLYKEEIEVLLRTPGHAGFHLLDLHDYPGQGTALIGPLDPFWDSKGFVTPETHRQYCGATVPLLRMPKRTYTAGEVFQAKVDVAHFGPANLRSAQVVWTIKDEAGKAVASGELPVLDLPTGKLTPVGNIRATFENAAAPSKLIATVALKGTEFSNQWDLWVYPGTPAASAPADVLMCDEWNDAAKTALADGKKVFVMTTKVADSLPGSFKPVFWSPIWFKSKPATMGILCDAKHPALAQFPTESYSNWQWWDIINDSRTLVLDATPHSFRPIVQVVDNFARNQKLGALFEARVGKGRLLVCSLDLKDKIESRPAAKQLLASLCAYLGSEQFQPSQELMPELLDKLLAKPVSTLAKLGAKVIEADSEDIEHPASNVIDGDPDTFWHTVYVPTPAPMPHHITIDMGRELTLSGLTYQPRLDSASGRVRECEVFFGNNPAERGKPVATATFKNNTDLQTIGFKQPAKGRYLTFVVRSEMKDNPFAAVAEIDAILNKP